MRDGCAVAKHWWTGEPPAAICGNGIIIAFGVAGRISSAICARSNADMSEITMIISEIQRFEGITLSAVKAIRTISLLSTTS